MNPNPKGTPMQSIALEQAQSNYTTVGEQIDEREDSINAKQRIIDEAQETIRRCRESIALDRAEIRKMKARRKVFARAHFQLEQIDENS
jgi:hypothetical protein